MMPIRDKSLYPKDWKEIREAILKRDDEHCKFCGAPNHVYITRSLKDPYRWAMDDPQTSGCLLDNGTLYKWSEAPEEFAAQDKLVWVVLTIAHLDHDPTHNEPENLASLCQRCHLRYDYYQHQENARKTRHQTKRRQLEAKGQQELL